MTRLSVEAKKTARNEVFGTLLRERRVAAGHTQEALAFAAGLERTTVSIIERGLRSVSIQTLYQIACALDTTAAELVQEWESRLPQQARGTA